MRVREAERQAKKLEKAMMKLKVQEREAERLERHAMLKEV
jgi:hypothetical protein